MPTTVHLKTAVLEGGRVEFVAPQLLQGRMVEVFVIDTGVQQPSASSDLLEWLQSLPPRRTLAEWAQFEKEFQSERDAWDK